MKIKQLHLENYGRFEDLTIDFATKDEHGSNVTVIVGNNGAGKSQILQALATGLSWFVNGLLDYGKEIKAKPNQEHKFLQSDESQYIQQPHIMNGKDYAELKLSFNGIKTQNGHITINSTRKDILRPAIYGTKDIGFNKLIKKYAKLFEVNTDLSLPIVAYYPVDRGVVSTPMEVNEDSVTNQLTAYEGTLKSSVSFESFFSWFREREDIENESFTLTENKVYEIRKSKQLRKLVQSEEFRAVASNTFKEVAKDQELIMELMEKIEKDSAKIEKGMDKLGEEVSNINEDITIKHQKELSKFEEYLGGTENAEQLVEEFMDVLFRGFIRLSKELPKIEYALLYDRQLRAVRMAIEAFTGLKNPIVRRQSKPTMFIEKNGEELDVNQLSQGEKSLLALVGDIARRLVILNPSLENPLQGEGVVMIDEVDLHLHPKWQHDLIDKLVKTFPNVQFILTTHSPHIVSDRNDILIYSLDNGELEEVPNVYGQDVNTVLTKVFDVDIRDSAVETQLNDIRRAISHKDYPTAEEGIEELANKMPADDLELLKCRLMLAQAKVNDKDDNELVHADD